MTESLENVITSKDIYNEFLRLRQTDLRSKTQMERVFQILDERNFLYDTVPSPDQVAGDDADETRLECLFFAKQDIIDIWQQNGDVLVIAVTYKTNYYGLPLVAITGITRAGACVPFAHYLVINETADTFDFVIRCIRELIEREDLPQPTVVFLDRDRALIRSLQRTWPGQPTMLCTWHMNADVEAACIDQLGPMDLNPHTQRFVLTEEMEKAMAIYRKVCPVYCRDFSLSPLLLSKEKGLTCFRS